MMKARFAAQLQVLQASGETAHQRLDVARVLGLIQIAEIRGRQRFLAARAVPRGAGVVVAGDRVTPAPSAGSPSLAVAHRAGRLPRARRHRVAFREYLLVRRQEVGVEQRIEAPPFVAAAAQQRLEAPAQDLLIENAGLHAVSSTRIESAPPTP